LYKNTDKIQNIYDNSLKLKLQKKIILYIRTMISEAELKAKLVTTESLLELEKLPLPAEVSDSQRRQQRARCIALQKEIREIKNLLRKIEVGKSAAQLSDAKATGPQTHPTHLINSVNFLKALRDAPDGKKTRAVFKRVEEQTPNPDEFYSWVQFHVSEMIKRDPSKGENFLIQAVVRSESFFKFSVDVVIEKMTTEEFDLFVASLPDN
jgi:hypothetical protein